MGGKDSQFPRRSPIVRSDGANPRGPLPALNLEVLPGHRSGIMECVMDQLLGGLLFFGVWLALQAWVLPKVGVST